jgi:hypothetical protein
LGQFPEWFCRLWLWFDWLCVVVLEELPLAAFAIAAPPPATTPSDAAVAAATRSRLSMIDTPLSSRIAVE